MASSLRSRLDRVSKALATEKAAEQAASSGNHRMLAMMAMLQVQQRPVLKYVEPEDTDPATYAGIQHTLAQARGQWNEAAQWHQVMEEHRADDPEYIRITDGASIRALIEQINDRYLRGEKSNTGKAVANAERRLGTEFVQQLSPKDPI